MSRMSAQRVSLREFRQEDISGIRSWVTDIDSTKYLGGGYLRPQTWEQSERYLSALLEGDAGGINLVIADKDTLRYLGQCTLMMIDTTARHAELAAVMCPKQQNQGLGSEGIRLMLRYAFEELNLHRIYLKVHAENTGALRCYEKCGFVREGILRAHAYGGGKYHDVICMGILKEEWEGLRNENV